MRRYAKTALLPLLVVLCATLGTKGGVLQVPTGSWVPAANLIAARADSTATLLQDGRVLIAGGSDANGTALASAEFFGAGGSVSSAAPMNSARARHFAVALQDGRVLVGGGVGANGMPQFSAEIFDPIANSWTPAATGMVEARAGAAAGLMPDGRVVISGGDSGSLPSMTLEIFDPASGSFSSAGTMTSPRTRHAMAVLNDGRVMVFGGWSGSAVLQTTDIFDPATGQVSPGPQLLAARMSHTATTALTGPVVIAGGTDGKNDLNTVEIFDPAAGTIAAGTSLATARQGQLAVLLPNNNNILYVGGTSAGAPVANAEIYSPWQATMTAAGANAVARSKAAAAGTGADGVLLVSGGTDANGADSSGNELYGFATVKTDAADYAPGSTVTITGTGWKPGETVTLTLAESPLIDTHAPMTEVADANGNFVNTDFSPDSHDVNVRFFLTAVGSNSGLQAQNTFTDAAAANVEFSTTGLPAATSVTVNWTGTNNGGNPIHGPTTFAAPGPTGQIGVGPNTAFTYSFPASIVTGLGTFNLGTTSPTSPFNTGAGNNLTNVTANYAPAAIATTTTVSSSLNPSNYGQSVTFTAKVAPASGTTAPTGSVQFKIDGVNSGSAVAVSACAPSPDVCATLTTSTLAAANHTIEADFTGTGVFTNSSGTLSGGQNVNKATLTASIIGTPSKPYDGNTNATLTSANYQLSGLVGTDSFTVTKTTGTYNSKDVGAATTVTATLAAGDFTPNGTTVAANYTLPTTASGPGSITAITLTASITGNPTRPYNGNTNATLTSANFSLSGLIGSDSFTITKTSGTYNSKDVVTAATVTASLAPGDFAPNGTTVAGNYTLPTTATGAGHITAVTLTASIINLAAKPYDGNTNATLTSSNFSLSGLVSPDSFTVTKTTGTYNSKDVATATTVTVSLVATDFTPVGATLASNYSLPTTASGSASITTVTLTASIVNNPKKPYDGNTSATLISSNFSLSGLVTGESITVTQTAGTYNSKDVATANTVTASLAAANFTAGGGTLLSNYVLPTTASGPGQITAVTLTAAIIGAPTRPYNGNTNATLTSSNFSLSGLVGSESFTITKTSGTYNSKDVAAANTVTASLAAGDFTPGNGAIASNYVLPTTASGPGQITAITLTAAIIGAPTRPYNGNTNATLTPANFSLSGLVGTESFTVTQTAGTYNSKDVTAANTVTASLVAGNFTPANGANATNYVLPTSASGAGNITPATLTASIFGDPSKPYDGNTSATLTAANFSLSGLATGESFTVTKTSGTYNSKDVAAANTVTASLAAADFTPGTGTLASNYTLPTTASGPGSITAVTLTAAITGTPTRPYNGNTTATLTSSNFSLSGLVGTEFFTITQTAGNYNSKDVATANTVTASLAAGNFTPGNGAVASNYVLPTTASGPGQITAVTLTAAITGNPTRPYNGNTNATLTPANFSLSGLVGTESFTVTQTAGTYNSKDVATANTVTASLGAGDFSPANGANATNYVLPTSASGAGHITPATLSASIIGDPSKPYDGNTNATLTAANFSLSGLATGESFTVTKTSGTYNSKDVAAANTVTASLAAADFTPGTGTLASNYTLPTTASGAGSITAVTLTAAIIGNPTRPYNGLTGVTLTPGNFSLSGLVGTESFTITQTAGNYNSKDVATATTVSASLAAGNFTPGNGAIASNYSLPTTASGPGQITAITLTAAIIGDPTRPYNGNTNATLTSANFSLSGLVGTESFTVTQTAGTYNSKDVATANTVTASLGAGDFSPANGAVASNYVLATSASGAGHITAANLTASIIGDPSKPYDGNTNATLTPANFSLSGLATAESFTVTKTSGMYNYKDVATATTVTTSLAAADFTPGAGTLASNYTLPTTASGPGSITAVTLTSSIIGTPTKFFDGNTNATLTSANFSVSGLVSPDAITVTQTAGTYNSANAASATTVTASLAAANFSPAAGTLLSNYNLPTTASGPGKINADVTTAGVTSSVNPSIFGQSVTFTATVTNTSTSVTPTGSVQLVVDGVNFGSPVAISGSTNSATAQVMISTIGVSGNPHSVSANFVNSDGNFAGSNGALAGGQTVNPAPTSTGVTSSLNPSIFGQSVTFTATVTNTAGASISTATPTGSVQFVVDGVNFGSPVPVSGSGTSVTASSTATSNLNVSGSPHSVKAVYANTDQNFVGSNALVSGGQTVTKAPTTTGVVSSLSPSIFGQSVTFTATVTNTGSGATPSGNVQFVIDSGSPVSAALSGSGNIATATYSTTTLNVGGSPHSIVANYQNADGNFMNSSGNTTQTVTKAPTTTGVVSSLNPSIFGQSVTFTATVTNTGSTAAPTGSVQFVVDGGNFGTAVALTASGNPGMVTSTATATLTVPGSPHSIVANYTNSDGNFSGSSGNTTQSVTKASTMTTVISSGSPSTLHQNVTFTATVVDSTPMSTGTPTGTVNFYDGVNLIGSGGVNGSGVATYSTSTLAVGSHSITAQYAGDSNFTGSTSSAITQQVQYNFCLLYDPTRSVKGGATYPIKIYACDASGADVSSSAIIVHATLITQVSGFSGAPDDAGNANPDNDFRFDITLGPTGGYIFNLKTTGLASGTYMLNFTASNDPVTHTAVFGVK